jgi:hypothetical protein
MDSGKQQAFPYSMRTVAAMNQPMCNSRYHFQVTPPTNALTIESLFTHLVFQFDVSVASGNQTVQAIGITNQISSYLLPAPSYARYLQINQAADGSRRIDLKLDLSALLLKSNPSVGVDVILNSNLNGVSTIGTIEVWKTDALYTTTGIR